MFTVFSVLKENFIVAFSWNEIQYLSHHKVHLKISDALENIRNLGTDSKILHPMNKISV